VNPTRTAALWFSGYPCVLVAESLWVGVASRWLESARRYAGPDPVGHMLATGTGAVVGFTIAWFLFRGALWAYRIACAWVGVLGGTLLLWVLIVAVNNQVSSLRSAIAAHPFELGFAVATVLCLAGSLWQLRKPEVRAYFARHA
jgi:hypothetical protein